MIHGASQDSERDLRIKYQEYYEETSSMIVGANSLLFCLHVYSSR